MFLKWAIKASHELLRKETAFFVLFKLTLESRKRTSGGFSLGHMFCIRAHVVAMIFGPPLHLIHCRHMLMCTYVHSCIHTEVSL